MADKHFLIAAPTTPADLADAIFRAWPEHSPVGGPEHFESADALEASLRNRAQGALVMKTCGDWAVLSDLSGARHDAEEKLAAVARRYDRLIALAHQDSVGFFQFLLFERGVLVRKKSVTDGEHVSLGEPLPVERGPAFGEDEPAELDALWRSFGLDQYWKFWDGGPYTVFWYGDMPPAGCLWPFGRRAFLNDPGLG